ncbi:CoA-transferase subunit beta [Ramlibacter terrae]|uniref:CoA-transferase subunit beta n=1 Tax=Ramlibacter terrae TaxID=2732511 RepID=A0ABX6P765_9BURK|nr:CoA-transferase subunit beta [Ramlibacter terrae]
MARVGRGRAQPRTGRPRGGLAGWIAQRNSPAAARLAQLTHAPNLSIITSAVGFVANMVGKPRSPLFHSTMDWRNIYAGTEAVMASSGVFHTRRDWFFAGAMQVDGFGNINLSRVRLKDGSDMRGPGAAGLAYSSSMARRYFIYLHEHSTRSIVDRLDYLTAVGYGDGPGSREKLALRGGGPALVISPRGVMDFDPKTLRLRLRSVHPGQEVAELVANTGCELLLPASVPVTTAPTTNELDVLRTQVDRGGVLRH